MKNYYRDVVYYILDSKLSADRKLKLIFNLIFSLEDKRNKGITIVILTNKVLSNLRKE